MLTLNINDSSYTFDEDQDMPLLWALRDIFGLKGTKYGCGMGLCGACTVHLDGEPTKACQTPISVAAKSKVTTIEGLEHGGHHPLQKAWVTHSVPQCGYCQVGQIMTAAALLKSNRTPSDREIDEAMSGNLCRCGTYPRIKAAIKAASKASTAK